MGTGLAARALPSNAKELVLADVPVPSNVPELVTVEISESLAVVVPRLPEKVPLLPLAYATEFPEEALLDPLPLGTAVSSEFMLEATAGGKIGVIGIKEEIGLSSA